MCATLTDGKDDDGREGREGEEDAVGDSDAALGDHLGVGCVVGDVRRAKREGRLRRELKTVPVGRGW